MTEAIAPPDVIPLAILIGLPGSGKSTLAGWLTQDIPNTRIISTDRIRARFFGDEATQGPWMVVWQEVERRLHSCYALIESDRLTLAVYDATNTARKQRRRIIELARGIGFTHIVGIWMAIPLETCLERNAGRDRFVPEPVILKMQRQLEASPPTLADGFDELLVYPTSKGVDIALGGQSENRTQCSKCL